MNTKKSGFSLIELLVVIVIMGILATVSLGTFGSFFAKARDANRRSVMSSLHTILATEILEVSAWRDKTNIDNAKSYIEGLMENNGLALPYESEGCYRVGFVRRGRDYFVAFIQESNNTWEGFSSSAAIEDEINEKTSDFETGCLANFGSLDDTSFYWQINLNEDVT